ncbi:MAG: SAM-dependent methyltransferase [Thermoproteota archaeon]|nr:SAM-dependent methyltransferase [Thermoproteota archaeon]
MKIAEFVTSLPRSVVSGEHVFLPDGVVRRILTLADLRSLDVFYDLGCGNSNAILIAAKEYGVRKSIGIENRKRVIKRVLSKIAGIGNALIIDDDIRKVQISDADVILFWFYDEPIVRRMLERFTLTLKKGTRIISIWSPPGLVLPDKIDFPFFVSCTPFRFAENVEKQFESIYGQPCIDFTGSWLLAEKYIDGIGTVSSQQKRFVNILYSMIIWINAWNMDLACEEQIPPPVESYLGILRTFFNIDLSDMFEM